MPDGEGSIVGNGEQAILSVGAYLRKAYRSFLIEGICQGCIGSDLPCLLFERYAYKGIFQTFQVLASQALDICRTVVYVLTIGREGWKGFQLRGVAGKGRGGNGVIVKVCHIYITLCVVHLQSFAGFGMEGRSDDVGREGDISARRTEAIIYTR